jgi:tetratricopeptide (TPR) repeat protein
MALFDGLYAYEVVLLVLGVLLFLVLLVAFVVLLTQRRRYGNLLAFFAIPIVMIGYPSIKSFQFKDGVVTIEKDTLALQQDPQNKPLRDKLSTEVANISPRPSADPGALTKVARAQIALGYNAAAEANVQKALQVSPQFAPAVEAKARLDLDRKLATLASQLEQNPNDSAAKAQLQQAVSEAARLHIASPVTLANVAHAHMVIGDHAQAESAINKALAIDPNLAAAKELKNRIGANVVQPAPGHP